ncbi:Vps5-domain-containing protein [Trichodelitschia bisporula]|uniref:Vps5-domain-containing protein n=1 Tax=Trichodelitschia bisporula TaxID=703511 RepID=A0A6G1HUV7_9PEZI|nr:Vps5-domain-containing protein [Trichodelitschia bisporula]
MESGSLSDKRTWSFTSLDSLRSHMNIPPMNMDLDHEGGSPWDDEPSLASTTNPPASDAPSGTTLASPSSKPAPSASTPAATTSAPSRSRPSRTPKRYGTQPTRLEAVDSTLGPLGPLGDDFPTAEPLASPGPAQRKEQIAPGPPPGSSQSSLRDMMHSVDLNDNGDGDDEDGPPRPRVPPPVQPPQGDFRERSVQPSVSVVEAAKPSFQITVGDPHKVGDLTSAHTEYQVYTKTTSKAYRNPEFVVSRRFRDFLWLYNQLHTNNPGIIIPPPPEKQAVGRFNADFVESRRQALERMLNKTAAHPTLQHDGDLKLFLESESFNVDLKHRERKEPLVGESKGVFSSIGIGASTNKFIEHDDWFHDRKVYLDVLENQLKALQKAVDTVIVQRKSLAEACGDFSASLHTLAAVELSSSLSGPLDGLSELQMRIRELYERQAQQDVLTLGIVIDEYIRLIGSCKMAFGMRQKSYQAWQAAQAELVKKRTTQEKLQKQGRTQQDRLGQLSAEVSDAEKKAHQGRVLFDDMGRILRQELDRFEREKVEEFKSGVETYLESAVEAQKELIEIWETYLMRLDAEDDAPSTSPQPAPAKQAPSEAGERPVSQGTDVTGEHENDE